MLEIIEIQHIRPSDIIYLDGVQYIIKENIIYNTNGIQTYELICNEIKNDKKIKNIMRYKGWPIQLVVKENYASSAR